jgi:PPOX class probable F420-dependent enzyme
MPGLTGEQARALLAGARVARLASVSAAGMPHLVPVTFALAGDVLYTAVDGKPKSTRGLRRLDNIRGDPRVAVLADHYEENWGALWWARADGTATVIDDPGLMAAPLALLARRYPQYDEVPLPGPVIAVQITVWTGWTATGRPPSRP